MGRGGPASEPAAGALRESFDPSAWSRVYSDPVPTPSQRLFRRVTEEVFRAVEAVGRPGQSWLDLGCGTGELVQRLAQAGLTPYGVDHDPRMLGWARRSTAAGAPGAFIAADATRIPMADRSVDGVVAASLTGCLTELTGLWRELARVLTGDGRAVLSFTNADSVVLAASTRLRRRVVRENRDHPCHGTFHRYRINAVVDGAARHGLELEAIHHFNCYVDLGNRAIPPEGIARLLERSRAKWVGHRLCRNFVVVLRPGH